MTPETFLALTARNKEPAFLLTDQGRVLAANARGSELLGCARRCIDDGVQLDRYVDPSGAAFPDLMAAWTTAGLPLARTMRLRRSGGGRLHCRAEGIGVTDPGDGSTSLVLLHVVPLDPAAADESARLPPEDAQRQPAGDEPPREPARGHAAPEVSSGDGPSRPVGKMEAMGNLAAGIAHDFNNLLTVMKVEVELILEDPSVPARAIDSLLSAHAAVLRAESLVSGLLAFSRRQLVRAAEVDLGTLLDRALPRLRAIVADTELVLERAPVLLPLRVDAEQMEAVLLALVRNAVEASSAGGAVVVRIRRETIGPAFVRDNEGSVEGSYAVLEVEDRGTGITPDVEARMFEPFFTTKGRGYGRGLGLARAFGIVKMLGGYLKVTTALGDGSIFTVYLPLDEAEPG